MKVTFEDLETHEQVLECDLPMVPRLHEEVTCAQGVFRVVEVQWRVLDPAAEPRFSDGPSGGTFQYGAALEVGLTVQRYGPPPEDT